MDPYAATRMNSIFGAVAMSAVTAATIYELYDIMSPSESLR